MYMTIQIIFQMACIPMPECNFMHRYFRCFVSEATMDVEVKVKMMRGIHTFRSNHTTQVMSCKPSPIPVTIYNVAQGKFQGAPKSHIKVPGGRNPIHPQSQQSPYGAATQDCCGCHIHSPTN